MDDYRTEIYREYATDFSGGGASFDRKKADRMMPVFQHYLRGWLPEDKCVPVVDLGCGDGRNLYILNRLGYSDLTGVDRSASQVRLASEVSARIVHGDVLEFLRDSSGGYGLILSVDLIEHLNKGEALEFLKLCCNRLRPGGRLVLQTPNASSPFFGSVRYGDFTHEIGFTPPLLSTLVARAGFLNVETRETGPVPLGYSWKSSLRYVAWRGVSAVYSLLDRLETGGSSSAYTRVFLATGLKAQ